MLDQTTLNRFASSANSAYQQFCIWIHANNEFAKHQKEWNQAANPRRIFLTEKFSRDKGCRYKNFWGVVIPSLQHGWILSLARLLDPAYHSHDKKKDKPRLSLDYILELLDDAPLAQSINNKIESMKQQFGRSKHSEITLSRIMTFISRALKLGRA